MTRGIAYLPKDAADYFQQLAPDKMLTDLGPFRAICRELLLALDMRERTYGWPVELIVKEAGYGARIVELAMSYWPHLAGRSRVGGTVRDTILATYRILRTTLRYVYDTS